MPRQPTAQQLYDELLDRYGQSIADAFFAAIDDLRSAAEIQRLQTAIAAGDLEAALDALHLDAAAYGPMLDEIAKSYTEGGQGAAGLLPKRTPDGAALIIRFNARNARAERWLRDHSSELITHILDDQRQAVRQALTSGLERGENPRTTALDIVGRIDKTSGKRVGGVIGLSAPQQTYVESARAELAAGDPASLRKYLTRERRDRRFDRSIAKAIRDETSLPADIQAKAVVAYERRLQALRGETLAANETFASLEAARREAYAQAIESGKLTEAQVKKTWRHFRNSNPREQHIAMNGKKVGFNSAFIMPDGTRMMYPHDPSAPAKHTVGCHCQVDYEIDWAAGLE